MAHWWKNLGLQTRFMLITGFGVLGLAASVVCVVAWFEYSQVERKLSGFAENEIGSMHALVVSVMERRLTDTGNVAIDVFNKWFERRNLDYPGKVWSVWSPKVTAFMARTASQRAPKPIRDAIDEEAMRTGQPIGRFIDGAYRYSLPIVLGVTPGANQQVCHICHGANMGIKDGEVIAVFSTSLATDAEFAGLRRLLIELAAAGVVAALLMVATIRVIFGRIVSRRLNRMTGAMRRLADGDRTVEIPPQVYHDEIGVMADTMAVFGRNAEESDRLAAERHAEDEAKANRAARLADLVRDFQAQVGGMAGALVSASGELEGTARAMAGTAVEANTQSATAAAAARDASAGIQAVAAAAEQLSASIGEITRQTSESARMTAETAQEARRTDAIVKALADGASRIGDIVAMISGIAGQTNLLALNATIEAARAGDAGKGFSVVASEVKNLANQTAKATGEIGAQIGEVQKAVGDVVTAIHGILDRIERISVISTAMATSVEQQGSATSEISRQVQKTAANTRDVVSSINGVSQTSNNTDAAANQVLASAGQLSRHANQLTGEVEGFVTAVRAA